jgi:NodT family efflux transporter outer membrane factor (OMF) lipoprotein
LLDLAAQRRRTGLSTEIDVSRAAAEVSDSEAELPLLDRQIQQDINRLSRLLALEPGSLEAELDKTAPIPPAPPVVPIGLPADLIRQRPDIREAEDRLHAATAEVGVAVADLFPRVTLNAEGGYQSETLASLTGWASRFLTAGPAIELPVFDAGQRRAVVRLQETRQKAAAVAYAQAVLSALHEVDDTLIAYGEDQRRGDALARTVGRDQTALDLARQRYAAGVGDFIDVLDAERSLQQGELQLTDAQASVSADLVALYRSLGGGWREAPAA